MAAAPLRASAGRGSGCGHGGVRTAAAVALGCVREKEQRRRWGRGSEREGSRGWRGAAGDAQGEEEAARQGGGVASSAASRCPSSAYWHEEEGDREGGGGLGQPAAVLGRLATR